jgi:hypothetical protein
MSSDIGQCRHFVAFRGVLLDVRPYQLGCGTAAHLPSAGRQPLASPPTPATQPAEAAVSCSTTTEPASKSPAAVLVSQQLQSGQRTPQSLQYSSTSAPSAAASSAHAPNAQAGRVLGPPKQMACMCEASAVLTPAQDDQDPARQFGCAGTAGRLHLSTACNAVHDNCPCSTRRKSASALQSCCRALAAGAWQHHQPSTTTRQTARVREAAGIAAAAAVLSTGNWRP